MGFDKHSIVNHRLLQFIYTLILTSLLCHTDGAIIDEQNKCKETSKICIYEGLTSIPRDIPGFVKHLKISKCNISIIPSNVVAHVPLLKSFTIEDCSIRVIKSCAFSDLSGVKFSIRYSDVHKVEPYAFSSLSKINLTFESTSFNILRPNSFSNIIHVGYLEFVKVNITEFGMQIFHNVSVVVTFQIRTSSFRKIHSKPGSVSEVAFASFYRNKIQHGCNIEDALKKTIPNLWLSGNTVICNCCANATSSQFASSQTVKCTRQDLTSLETTSTTLLKSTYSLATTSGNTGLQEVSTTEKEEIADSINTTTTGTEQNDLNFTTETLVSYELRNTTKKATTEVDSTATHSYRTSPNFSHGTTTYDNETLTINDNVTLTYYPDEKGYSSLENTTPPSSIPSTVPTSSSQSILRKTTPGYIIITGLTTGSSDQVNNETKMITTTTAVTPPPSSIPSTVPTSSSQSTSRKTTPGYNITTGLTTGSSDQVNNETKMISATTQLVVQSTTDRRKQLVLALCKKRSKNTDTEETLGLTGGKSSLKGLKLEALLVGLWCVLFC